MASPFAKWKSLFGAELGIGAYGELASKLSGQIIRLTQPAVDASISFTAAVASSRTVTVQLKDRKGNVLNYNEIVQIALFTTAGPADFAATGGSVGIAAGANGKLQAIIAKKLFRGISDATGKFVFTYGDAASEVVYLGVTLPNGRTVMGAVMTTA